MIKKTVRSNDVETRFIKYSKSIISPIISDLFNLCVNKGVFPNCLKIAEIIPIHKKGDINKATNYRPIALLSHFNKLMEKMIFSRLYSYLEKKQLLNDNQFGFRPNSSTAFAISSLYDKLINNIDNGLFSCCVFLDFSKAFDTVDHKILLWKLHKYFGIKGTCLNLFESYLSNRYQYTNILGHYSNNNKITIRVPQESCLGPLLFLLYINDLPLSSNFDSILYADDTAMILSDSNINSLINRVNNELNIIDFWLRKNKLSLNYSKTSFIIFNKQPNKTFDYEFKLKINNNPIKRVNSIKYLGVLIDSKLSWSEHVDYLNLQLARYSGLFTRLRRYVTNEILCFVYYSIIYSRIKYGILSWDTASNSLLKKVEIRLNRILRVITNKSIYTPVGMLYTSLNTLKVTDIYNLELGKFMLELENNKLPRVFLNFFKKINEIHSHETRLIKTSTYFLPRVTKLFGQLLLSYRGVKL